MNDAVKKLADKKLSDLLDDCAPEVECFDYCGRSQDAIVAAFLRSSHSDEAFSEIDMRQLNEMVALIFDKSSRIDHERWRVALVAYLTNLATDSARAYVDGVLPEKCQTYRFYQDQDAQADRHERSLSNAIVGIALAPYRFL